MYDYSDVVNKDRRVNQGAWSAKHDLIHYLVPFEHFAIDPWGTLNDVGAWLADQPDTSPTWHWSDVPAFNQNGNFAERRRLFSRLLGAYRVRTSSSNPDLWVNPTYPQEPQLEWVPLADKTRFYREMALLGRWSGREAANFYNAPKNNAFQTLRAEGEAWSAWREYGKRRLANTVVLVTNWTDRTIPECAAILDVAPAKLQRWCRQDCTLGRVPRRPTETGIARRW